MSKRKAELVIELIIVLLALYLKLTGAVSRSTGKERNVGS